MYEINRSAGHLENVTKRGRGNRVCKFLLFSGFLILIYILIFGNLGFADLDRKTFIPKSGQFMSSLLMEEDEIDTTDPVLDEILFVQENFEIMEQTDPKLIRYVRARYITQPPPKDKPYNLKFPKYQKTSLGKWVRTFYKDKRAGVFLEAGANSGESSNTIELEIELAWSGVLIECNPKVIPVLRDCARKSWLATVCLSLGSYPKVVNMSVPETWTLSARLGPAWDLSKFGVISNWTYLDGIESVPLYSILASVGLKEIDYFSFDIEGAEFAVLKNFPFDKILIKVLILEVYFYSAEEKTELTAFLKKNGLVFIRNIEMDQIYVHESLLNRDGVGSVEELAKL